MTFLWEIGTSRGVERRTEDGFSATGFNGVNCFESVVEFVKGGNGVSPILPRPKQDPERYSDGCIARSIWISLLPTLS
jgi:hypothetical protein